jgi:hydrophobic/amphiphilic exporter-1 (mainly G- bacteria), HAE1 family
MNIAALFIRRPIMTTLVMIAFVLFGIVGFRALPVSDLPNIDFPTIVVTGNLPGASPETMAASVATPLERQFSTIAGIDSMTSTSALGTSQITLQFDLSRDIDAAAQDVQSAITASLRQLPQNMSTPPTYRKVNPADQPVLHLALSSPTLPLSTVNEYADTFLAQRVSMVKGVAQVQVYGAQKYAVRARLNPEALAARSVGLDEVTSAIQQGNVNLPTGTLLGRHQVFTVQASGQLMDAAAYRPLIVAYRNGAPIRLGDLGQVIDSVENDRVASWFNGDRAIVLAIQKQPGANTVEVVDSIRKLLPALRAGFPASIKIDTLFDRSISIRESVRDVEFTLLLAIILVVLVIFLFLRNLSATVIPSLALPICIIGTFAFMYLYGFSLDNLSLMALTLAVGFVVDDAIVMLENIVRHMEAGEKPFEAALKGSREIAFTIVSMTLSLVAVFIPVLFMGGIVGRMLHEFAVTIGVAILISGAVSLTLTPMLSSLFLRPPKEQKHGHVYAVSERFFDGMLRLYERSLTWVLGFRGAVMIVSALFLVASVYLFMIMPKGFLPSEDTGQIVGFTEAVEGIGFDAMVEHQQAVAALVRADTNVDSLMSSVGSGGGVSGTNAGRLLMRLKPRSQRKLSADEVVQGLRPKLASVPGIQVFLQNPPPIAFGGRLTKSQYQYTLRSPDTDELYRFAPVLESRLKTLAGFQDVTSDLQIKNPQVDVTIDRDKASVVGVTAEQVEEALQTAYASNQISTIYAPNNQYRVIVELERKYQTSPEALNLLYVRSAQGRLVPLSTVSLFKRSVGPLTVTHSGQLPSVTISFSLANGKSLGDALNEVEEVTQSTLPASITGGLQGTAQAFQSSFRGLWVLLLMAILVIYIVLGILYESFVHPLTILSGLPSAGLGALLTLMLFGIDLNLYALVGIIMLIGIVKKNAIMMIDFALEAERSQGKTPAEAIYQGAIIRFRPIMMTTMAALMATLPIALGFGAGAESRRPLGLAVVGGLVFSQVVTLYITPVIYTYLDSAQTWVKSRVRG